MVAKAEAVEETLRSANDASRQARNMWLGFLGLLSYLVVTLASVTHKDLLLNSAVNLPIVGVELPLFSFFLFGPFLLVLFHFGLLMQHVTLSQKLAAFDSAITEFYRTSRKQNINQEEKAQVHPARLRLIGYAISQYVSGPPNSWVVKCAQWLMGWLTIIILPLVILLYFQIQFLPYDSHLVTGLHRLTIILDLVMLILLGVLIDYPTRSIKEAFVFNLKQRIPRFVVVALGVAATLLLTICIATIPDGSIEKFLVRYNLLVIERSGLKFFWPTAYLEPVNCEAVSWFSRNLIVKDTDLVPDKNSEPDEPSHSLRNRDLRYSCLNRSDLHRVDLTEANLTGSSLVETRLRKALLERTNLANADLSKADLRQAILRDANLPVAKMRGARLQDADLVRAKLPGSDLTDAGLQGSNLTQSFIAGAIFRLANLRGADLRSVMAQAADFGGANLQGANLVGASLHGAYLSGADLKGADLQRGMI